MRAIWCFVVGVVGASVNSGHSEGRSTQPSAADAHADSDGDISPLAVCKRPL